jgi:hypothetical protein
MAYLTTKSLPSDVESIVAWSKPHDLTLHITLDPLSDTMMVQLGWMTLVRGVKFGGMSLPREDVLFILDRCASDLRGDIERYIANGEKPKPPWIVRIADSIDRRQAPGFCGRRRHAAARRQASFQRIAQTLLDAVVQGIDA